MNIAWDQTWFAIFCPNRYCFLWFCNNWHLTFYSSIFLSSRTSHMRYLWCSRRSLVRQMRDSLAVSCFLQVHNILAEMVMGGMVLETNMNEIITQVDAQNKMEKSEVSAPACQLYVQLYSTTVLWGMVHSMQACVYAAPCMLLFSGPVDAPYLLLSVCALFSASSPAAAAVLQTQVLSISSPVRFSIKYSIIVTFTVI